METANEKFKKQLEKLIPQLNTEIGDLSVNCLDVKYLDHEQNTFDMIESLDK